MLRSVASLAVATLFSGCATAPFEISDTHPANPAAPEAATPSARAILRPDANTLRTRTLLAQRAQQAGAAEAETPVDQVKPGPNEEHTSPAPMKGMDMNGMKGMDMKDARTHENH